jgi:hypothetical protein
MKERDKRMNKMKKMQEEDGGSQIFVVPYQ